MGPGWPAGRWGWDPTGRLGAGRDHDDTGRDPAGWPAVGRDGIGAGRDESRWVFGPDMTERDGTRPASRQADRPAAARTGKRRLTYG